MSHNIKMEISYLKNQTQIMNQNSWYVLIDVLDAMAEKIEELENEIRNLTI